MKLAPILVLCLAVSIHQATAKPFSLDAISDGIRSAGSVAEEIANAAGSAASGAAKTAGSIASGIAKGASGAAQNAIGIATGMAKGAIGVGTNMAAGIADRAASAAKSISEKVETVKNAALKTALTKAQDTLRKVQDQARGNLQASEIVAKNAAEGVIELEDKKNELIQEWAEKANAKLANASDETKEKGEDLINEFVDKRSEAIKQASDRVLETLEELQEKSNATANKYHEPMNKLIEQVGKCSEIKVSQARELAKCAGEIRNDLTKLAPAPHDLAKIKAELVKAAGQNIVKDIRVRHALSQFREKSKDVEAILDRLVAQDQKNQEKNPEEDEAVADDENEGQEEDDAVAPEEDDAVAPEEDDAVAPEEDQQSEDGAAVEEADEEAAQ